jgi:hypothetical protein
LVGSRTAALAPGNARHHDMHHCRIEVLEMEQQVAQGMFPH